MKFVAFNGSSRKDGNTTILINHVFRELEKERVGTERVGAAVVAVSRSGAVHTLDSINHFFLGTQMIMIGRGIGVGRDKGDVEKDEEGIQAVTLLGRRMAWCLKKLYG